MIGLLIVTEGYLALELRSALEKIVGAQPSLAAICLHDGDDMAQRRREMQIALNDLDTGSGVLIATVMFDDTAKNLAISMMERKNTDVIGGVNLPMLVNIAKLRDRLPLAVCADAAQAAAWREYIGVPSQLMAGGREARQTGALGAVGVSSAAPSDTLRDEAEKAAVTEPQGRAEERARLLDAALAMEATFAQGAAREVAAARAAGVEIATLPVRSGHGGGTEPGKDALHRA